MPKVVNEAKMPSDTGTVTELVIVGGGSAGWLTAGILAAEHLSHTDTGLKISLIESPDVKPIGVGEGTWPTMRATLKKIGISETDFLRECDASFKQGSKFSAWQNGVIEDSYHHPFSLPHQYATYNLAEAWQAQDRRMPFADAVSFQSHLCGGHQAPKQMTTPEYAFMANYGYHLDAGKFAVLLQKHCTEKLGVVHVRDHVTQVNSAENGDIASVSTQRHGNIEAQLFVDCTGSRCLLLGEHLGVPFESKKDSLFIDSALAIQIPYENPSDPINSFTLSTAQSAGWVWDIGLQSRRGVGHVYSSSHTDKSSAEDALQRYLDANPGDFANATEVRSLSFNPGHRRKFWERNCVAVGMAAGFIEPLEASALVMVELSASMISDQLPANRGVMDTVAKRFNETFLYHWARVIDFLKLHYALSERRDSSFWVDNTRPENLPENLQTLLNLWRYQAPWHQDLNRSDELFSTASFQYVLYGMGFKTEPRATARRRDNQATAERLFAENAKRVEKMLSIMPSNRELLDKINEFGLQTI